MSARPVIAALAVLVACAPRTATPSAETFVLASTTSTQDSGLLDALTPAFERAFPRYRLKIVAVGSGEAMDLGRRGDADVLLVHSPDDEEIFMREGRGVSRQPVMRNDFVIAGPRADRAQVRRASGGADAFRRIARAGARFVSRGDESGTHRRELRTWKAARVAPAGAWYLEAGQGMAETLAIASELRAYVLTDTATLTVVRRSVDLRALLRGDPSLINPYSVIPVKLARHLSAATAFARWITGPQGQGLIAEFGRGAYGAPLFLPAAG